MMKRKIWILTGLLFLIELCMGVTVYGETAAGSNYSEWYDEANEKYIYPVTPASEEWKNLDNYQKKADACNIPEGLIKKLSTEELYQLVMDYPLMINIFFYSSADITFEQMSQSFNGLEALIKRPDGVEVLLEKYNEFRVAIENEEDNFENLKRLHFMEILLSNKSVVNSMSDKQKDKLSKMIYKKQCEKKKNKYYKGFESKAYEYAENNETADVINEERGYKLSNPEGAISVKLFDEAETFQVGAVGKAYVRTPKGSLVKVSIMDEYDEDIIESMTNQIKMDCPEATIVYPASNKYNCHSYAWHSPSPVNPYWMNGSSAEIYETDGSYRAIASYPTGIGQRVVWHDYDWEGKVNFLHSGIVRSYKNTYDMEKIMVESKWSDGPVVLCKINDIPYRHANSKYRYYIRAN